MILSFSIQKFRTVYLLTILTFTILCGLIYAVAQSIIRHIANEPLVEMVQQASADLTNGVPVESVMSEYGSGVIDITTSVKSFQVIYGHEKNALAFNGVYDGNSPMPPSETFDVALKRGENRFTWQPQRGMRFAVIIQPFQGSESGYVLVGRSLIEAEKTIKNIGLLVGLTWIMGLILSFTACIVLEKHQK